MEKKEMITSYVWIVFALVTAFFVFVAIKSSVIYSEKSISPIIHYVHEKVISDNNSFKKIGDKYSIDYNQKRYIISDRDTTIQLGETVDQNGAISKTTKEFLVYNQHQKELVYKKEDILKNSKEISQIVNISRSHFFLVGIPSYFAAIIFLLITIFTFIVRKGEKGK